VTAHSSNGGACITSKQKCMPYSNLVLPKRYVTMYFFPKAHYLDGPSKQKCMPYSILPFMKVVKEILTLKNLFI
jgi:hypothetical protein